jgi:predicted dehydrogenase
MISTSKRTGKFFMEALWTRFNPIFKAVKELIGHGEIGEIRYIQADFSFLADFPLSSRVFDLKLGGGAILDIGIYPAFLAYTLLGKPEGVKAESIFNKLAGCDVQTSMILTYKKAHALLFCSFTAGREILAKIGGNKGVITIANPFHVATSYSVVKGSEKKDFQIPLKGNGFVYEIDACHKAIRAGKVQSELWSHQNSLDLIEILDRVRLEVGLRYPQE